MTDEKRKPLLGKVIISGKIELQTGLHIGASKETMDIGGIDAPVIRDPFTREPYIPGSSLKGKLRSIYERIEDKTFNRHGGQGIYRHECIEKSCSVCRVFGATAQGREEENIPARLIVRDCRLDKASLERLEKIDTGLQYTEWKFENSLDRITSAANPRQLERVPAGAKFDFEFIYNVETKNGEAGEDLNRIFELMNILEDDFLGGHGSRGYGRIKFGMGAVSGKKIEFYSTPPEQREQHCAEITGESIDECKSGLDRILTLFS